MNCQVFRTNVSQLLDRRLSEQETAIVAAHARWCSDCRDLLESRAASRAVIRQSNAVEKLPDLVARLIAAAKA